MSTGPSSELVLASAIALLSTAVARSEQPATAPAQDPGTTHMVQLLERIRENANPILNPYLNAERAEVMKQALDSAKDQRTEMNRRIDLVRELIFSGQCEEGIEQIQTIRQQMAALTPVIPPRAERFLRDMEIIAHLRLGELENCCAQHSIDSCFVPIKGRGIHSIERGSRGAIRILTDSLTRNPSSLVNRWLLNLAYMTLDEYPDEVPPDWLIPPEVFRSDYDIKRFFDVAIPTGLDVVGLSGGSVMEDFDGDGFLDLMASSWGPSDQVRYFRNNGDGTFSDRTVQAGLLGIVGGLNMVHADYNNDGHADVFILRGAWLHNEGRVPNSLLKNNGDGTFADVTEASGLLSMHPTQTAAWADYDNDGWVDLFIGNETSRRGGDHPCELFHNNGDGTFTERAAEAGVAHLGYVKGVVFGDYDNDRYPDIYVSVNSGPNVLYHNEGPPQDDAAEPGWRFSDATEAAGVREPEYAFPTWFWDYDNDGWLDLFVSGYKWSTTGEVIADYLGLPNQGWPPRLYHNNGDGTFEDHAKAANLDTPLLTMGSNFGDLDNDGWLDFYLGTGYPYFDGIMPNLMYRNDRGRGFTDVTLPGGFGHLQKGHGVVFADLDHDGDQDIFEQMGGGFYADAFGNVLFENPGFENHWIKIRLRGTRSVRSAVGARLHCVLGEGARKRSIHRVVGTGGSFGANPLEQHIGLGSAQEVRRLEIHWPSGGTQLFENLPADHLVRITEGQNEFEAVRQTRMPFKQ